MQEWVPYRNESLDELHRHDGRGDYLKSTVCPQCNCTGAPTIKCLDCFGCRLLCQDCILRDHKWLPLHRLKVKLQYVSFIRANI